MGFIFRTSFSKVGDLEAIIPRAACVDLEVEDESILVLLIHIQDVIMIPVVGMTILDGLGEQVTEVLGLTLQGLNQGLHGGELGDDGLDGHRITW